MFSLKIEISMSVGVYQHLKRAIAEDLSENGSGEHGEDGQDHATPSVVIKRNEDHS